MFHQPCACSHVWQQLTLRPCTRQKKAGCGLKLLPEPASGLLPEFQDICTPELPLTGRTSLLFSLGSLKQLWLILSLVDTGSSLQNFG
jgi:hypothetical protein